MYIKVYTVVYITVYTLVYSTVYTKVSSAVYSIELVTNRRQGRGCSSGNKSAQPATVAPGYSLFYRTVYSVQYTVYSVEYTVYTVQFIPG